MTVLALPWNKSTWWGYKILICDDCPKKTYRLPASTLPCLWCGGTLNEYAH